MRVTKHLIRANPRAVMEGETDGMIKLLSDPDDGTILGGAMVGLRASEVITAVALAVHAKLSVQVLAETAAVNPSMSESLQRAAEKAAEGMLGISRVTLTARSAARHDLDAQARVGDLDRAGVLGARPRSITDSCAVLGRDVGEQQPLRRRPGSPRGPASAASMWPRSLESPLASLQRRLAQEQVGAVCEPGQPLGRRRVGRVGDRRRRRRRS